MVELKIEPFLLHSTSLFKLSHQFTCAAGHTSRKIHLIHRDASQQARLTLRPGTENTLMHQQIPFMSWIQQRFHINNVVSVCLNMKWDSGQHEGYTRKKRGGVFVPLSHSLKLHSFFLCYIMLYGHTYVTTVT